MKGTWLEHAGQEWAVLFRHLPLPSSIFLPPSSGDVQSHTRTPSSLCWKSIKILSALKEYCPRASEQAFAPEDVHRPAFHRPGRLSFLCSGMIFPTIPFSPPGSALLQPGLSSPRPHVICHLPFPGSCSCLCILPFVFPTVSVHFSLFPPPFQSVE